MKKITLSVLILLVLALMACTSTTNPLSSESEEDLNNYNDTILFNTSGGNDHG